MRRNSMSYEFKPGDRVRFIEDIGGIYEVKGKTATVVYNDKMGGRQYAVDIDNFNDGHSCEGHVKSERGLWVTSYEIELIDKSAEEKLYTREEVDAEIAAVKAQIYKEIQKIFR